MSKPGVFTQPAGSGGGQPTITTTTDELASDVAMTTASTWYDGPSHALAAGTYLIEADIILVPSGFGSASVRIWDGTTVYAQTGDNTQASQALPMHITKIVTLATGATVKLSGSSSVAASTMKATDPTASGGGTTATRLTTLKLA